MEKMLTGFETFDSSTAGLPLHRNYLLSGDKGSGKENFVYKLLYSLLSSKMNVVYVTAGRSSADLLNDVTSRGINISAFLGKSLTLVDDFSRTVSPEAADNKYTRMLNGPLDLTGLSVSLTDINNEYLRNGQTVINVIDSLSALLLYNSPSTLFRFLQFVCGRSKMNGVTLVFLLDPQMHAPDVIETVKSLVDGVIDLKLDNGARYFTVSGVPKEVLEWKKVA